MQEPILVAGGAGYIGSVVVAQLVARGYGPVVYDDLSHGHRAALAPGVQLIVGDIGDRAGLDRAFSDVKPQAVMHFAAFIEAGESMQRPEKYFRNNTASALTLLEAVLAHQVPRFMGRLRRHRSKKRLRCILPTRTANRNCWSSRCWNGFTAFTACATRRCVISMLREAQASRE